MSAFSKWSWITVGPSVRENCQKTSFLVRCWFRLVLPFLLFKIVLLWSDLLIWIYCFFFPNGWKKKQLVENHLFLFFVCIYFMREFVFTKLFKTIWMTKGESRLPFSACVIQWFFFLPTRKRQTNSGNFFSYLSKHVAVFYLLELPEGFHIIEWSFLTTVVKQVHCLEN